ncbi:MAG: FAD-dependent oxidoreductase [Nitriliruptoraceae bacterium]|nr:FAD-dependent oxidoreductase [Nitriliruptoraceae bacterium]
MNQVDVVVAGAGVAGIAAAIEAAHRGCRVTIVDADPVAGGTARIAGGGMCLAGTPRQTELGIDDDPERALEDWSRWGGPDADLVWAERYLRASSGELWRYLGDLGLRFGDVRPQEGNRVPRWHAPLGGGRALMQVLERRARRCAAIRWSLGVRVEGLLREGGRVVGVRTKADGREHQRYARTVILATGGFASDRASVDERLGTRGSGHRILLGGGAGATGQGHRMLADTGAQLVNLDAIWMYPYATPDPADPAGDRGLVLRGMDGEVWVDRDGRRFHDESKRGGATGTPALLAQAGATAWAIVDAPIAASLTIAAPAYRSGTRPDREAIERLLATSPFVHRGDDLRQLADEAGIDGAALQRTISEHNAARAEGLGHDPVHGRPLAGLRPLDQPPYTAIQLFPIARKTLGGVRTDPFTRVLAEDGTPIDGLLAAGEVAGMAGGRINGRGALEGTMVGPSLFSGRIAGAVAAA